MVPFAPWCLVCEAHSVAQSLRCFHSSSYACFFLVNHIKTVFGSVVTQGGRAFGVRDRDVHWPPVLGPLGSLSLPKKDPAFEKPSGVFLTTLHTSAVCMLLPSPSHACTQSLKPSRGACFNGKKAQTQDQGPGSPAGSGICLTVHQLSLSPVVCLWLGPSAHRALQDCAAAPSHCPRITADRKVTERPFLVTKSRKLSALPRLCYHLKLLVCFLTSLLPCTPLPQLEHELFDNKDISLFIAVSSAYRQQGPRSEQAHLWQCAHLTPRLCQQVLILVQVQTS